MSEFRVGAVVQGEDGELGRLDTLIVDPINRQVTHLVVSHDRLAPRLLVPVDKVVTASVDSVTIDLDEDSLHKCVRFDQPDFNEPGDDWVAEDVMLDPGSYFLQPFASPLDGWALATHERVPRGEVSIRRGSEVYTSDGTRAGHVDEFLVDPADDHITHVVLREGHVFTHDDDVVIPVTNATHVEEGRIVLDIDLAQLAALDHIPVKRHGHVRAQDAV